MPILKGALIAPETGAGGGEEGDIAGAADPHRLALLVPDLVIPDEPLNDFGHDPGFLFPDLIAIEPALVVFMAIVDRNFAAVFSDQKGVIGQAYDHAMFDYFLNRILHRLPSVSRRSAMARDRAIRSCTS